MRFSNVTKLFKIFLLSPIFIGFCPLGQAAAHLVLHRFNFLPAAAGLLGVAINFLILFLSVQLVKAKKRSSWENALEFRLSWWQLGYVIFGFLLFQEPMDPTSRLNKSIFLFVVFIYACVLEGKIHFYRVNPLRSGNSIDPKN